MMFTAPVTENNQAALVQRSVTLTLGELFDSLGLCAVGVAGTDELAHIRSVIVNLPIQDRVSHTGLLGSGENKKLELAVIPAALLDRLT
jgi:hypothetical protein